MLLRSRLLPNLGLLACIGISLLLISQLTRASTELPSLGEDAPFNIEREAKLGRSFYERLLANGLIETNHRVKEQIGVADFSKRRG